MNYSGGFASLLFDQAVLKTSQPIGTPSAFCINQIVPGFVVYGECRSSRATSERLCPHFLNIADAYVCTYMHAVCTHRYRYPIAYAQCSYSSVLAACFIEKANSCGFFSGQATQFAKNLTYQIIKYRSRNNGL